MGRGVLFVKVAVASLFGFNLANQASKQICSFLMQRAGWEEHRLQLFWSLFPSIIHALLSSIWIVSVLASQGPGVFDNLAEGQVLHSAEGFGFSCGYFIFDTLANLDMYLRPGGDKSMLLHHAVASVGTLAAGFGSSCHPFLFLALLAEPNSIFLHSRQACRMLGLQILRPRLYQAIIVLNFLTFIMFRIAVHGYGLYKTFEAHSTLWWPLFLFGSFGGVSMFALNVRLLRSLIRSDLGRRRRH